MSNTFKDQWRRLSKSHDIPIQAELDEVKEDVHDLDERTDRYEDAQGNLKPGVHVDEAEKSTLHVTYDKNGVPVGSFVDEEGAEKAMTNGEDEDPAEVEKPGASIHTSKWDDCIRDVQEKQGGKANAYAVCTAQLGPQSFKSQYRHMAYVKAEIAKSRKEVAKMGIEGAGPIPESELARQDLEGEADQEEARVQEEKDKMHEN